MFKFDTKNYNNKAFLSLDSAASQANKYRKGPFGIYISCYSGILTRYMLRVVFPYLHYLMSTRKNLR